MIKKIIFIFIILASSSVYAQKDPKKNPVPDPDKVVPPNKGTKYCCIKGNYSDLKPGQCPLDHTKLLPEDTYYCEVCDSTSTKPSKCKHCTHDMVKIQCPVTVIKDERIEY
ncbi:MAG: hypothetical protein ACT4ON_00145 [Bacteroidota bacterium]